MAVILRKEFEKELEAIHAAALANKEEAQRNLKVANATEFKKSAELVDVKICLYQTQKRFNSDSKKLRECARRMDGNIDMLKGIVSNIQAYIQSVKALPEAQHERDKAMENVSKAQVTLYRAEKELNTVESLRGRSCIWRRNKN